MVLFHNKRERILKELRIRIYKLPKAESLSRIIIRKYLAIGLNKYLPKKKLNPVTKMRKKALNRVLFKRTRNYQRSSQ